MSRLFVAALVLAGCAPATATLHTSAATSHPYRDAVDPTTTSTSPALPAPRVVAVAATAQRVVAVRPTRSYRRPSTPVAAARSGDDCGGWRTLVAQYRWPVDTACRILLCESKGDPNAKNPSGATGLMQVKGGSTDPATNMAQAFAKWSAHGWQPWVCK